MPPKKGNEPSNKTVGKQKAKIIEDKTFGLKNKNKSKKVAQFVEAVVKTVQQGPNPRKVGKSAAELRKEQKAAEKQRKAELDAIFKVTKAAGENKAGAYQYVGEDPDEEYPDEQYFEQFHLESSPDALEEWIERERAKIQKMTPVTLETFLAWKERKRAEKEEAERKARRTAEEAYRRTGGGISGRDLFEVDASIFVDDEEGVDVYEFENLEGIDEDAFAAELGDMALEDVNDADGAGASSSYATSSSSTTSMYPDKYSPVTWDLNKTPKMLLTEWCQARKVENPKFVRVSDKQGACLAKCTLAMLPDLEFQPEETSTNVKEAEHSAALMVIKHLERIGEF